MFDIAFGVAFGAFIDNVGLGIVLGLAVGAAFDEREKRKK